MEATMTTTRVTHEKWPAERVLRTARQRTHRLAAQNQARTQRMLAGLLQEAGWTEQDFLSALVQDVASGRRSGPR
jgi:hypothetical protein